MNRHQRKLKGILEAQREHVDAYKAVWKKADEEDREPSDEERLEVESHMKAIEDLNGEKAEVEATLKTLDRVNEIGRSISVEEQDEPKREPARPKQAKTLGDEFIASEGYKSLLDRGLKGNWSTGSIDLNVKTTLAEGANWDASTGSPGNVAPFVQIDQQPGYLPTLYQALTISDLLGSYQTTSNSIRYVKESTSSNAADTVSESGAKQESALSFTQADVPVETIATWIPITEQALEDAGQIRQVINERLSLFVRQAEEDQLLNGSGTPPDLDGLLGQIPGGNQDVASNADAPNAADNVYAAISVARSSFLEPDGIVMHPDDWNSLRVLKDQNENYIGGSPFSNTGSNPGESLWGKRVVLTTSVDAGTALVGNFGTAAAVARRSGLTVEASNSHDTYFTHNLVAIRAEERLALVVYRPEAFATADLNAS